MIGRLMEWLRVPEPVPVKSPDPDCKHYKARVYGWCYIGAAYCPDCDCEVALPIVLNNWIERMEAKCGS